MGIDIGEKIKSIRNLKGKSTYELADLTGIPQSTISKLENSKKKADFESLMKIAKALEVSIDRLTGEDVKSIIEYRIQELDMTFEELAKKTNTPLSYFDKLDDIQPTGYDYDAMKTIANAIDMQPGVLRAALARQEPPVYDGVRHSVEEDFLNENTAKYTVAAHKTDGYEDDLTKDEQIAVKAFIEAYRKQKKAD